MTAPSNFGRDNQQFWEERGRADIADDRVTLMVEHARYVRYVHERELAFLNALLERHRPERVLDAGCGTGRLSLHIAQRAREVIGLDFSESLLERGRAAASAAGQKNLKFVHASVEAAADLGQFDLVMLSGVLNCLTDRDAPAVLEQSAARLRSGGLLYLRNTCATRTRIYRPGTPTNAPTIHRTSDEYLDMVRATRGLRLREHGYLFPPLCLPNMIYHHALPRALREDGRVNAALDAWFALESATADVRLRLLHRVYPALVRAIGKKTAFEVIVAEKS